MTLAKKRDKILLRIVERGETRTMAKTNDYHQQVAMQRTQRIREICKGSHIRDLIRKTGFTSADPVNRLLLFMMRRPEVVRVWLVRSIFRLRDRIAGHSQAE